MGQPVVHFGIIGADPQALRDYYGRLFGWTFDTSGPVAESVSEKGEYGYVDPPASGSPTGIPGGVGGGRGHQPHVVFYVGVPDVGAALREAVRLGGTRAMGPERVPAGALVVAHFLDPEGNLVGLAGPA
jgi:predicted enzyme related to lactoylglutathione lyase